METLKRIGATVTVLVFVSCGGDFLDVKQNRSQRIPVSLQDHQALVRNIAYINSTHELGMIGGDEYFVADGRLATLSQYYQRAAYVWDELVYPDTEVRDWNEAYTRILYANLVLQGVGNRDGAQDKMSFNTIKGEALFHRAYNYYQLAQLFCKPYQAGTSSTDQGVPLRLEPDVEAAVSRSTVEETYGQIQRDLEESLALIGHDLPTNKLFASRQAVLAMLAKLHLLKGEYPQAGQYAASCISLDRTLMDFNELDPDVRHPFLDDNGFSNPEVIFHAMAPLPTILGNRFNADTNLLRSYRDDDLRKDIYFFTETDGRITFKGTYTGGYGFFTGLAKDEVYLVLAESLARQGELEQAANTLEQLLANRMREFAFESISVNNGDELLEIILAERKKELVLRGVRWEDLRRLNLEPRFETTLIRNIDGQSFRLEPNDPRYTWPIPDREITLTGIQQNER